MKRSTVYSSALLASTTEKPSQLTRRLVSDPGPVLLNFMYDTVLVVSKTCLLLSHSTQPFGCTMPSRNDCMKMTCEWFFHGRPRNVSTPVRFSLGLAMMLQFWKLKPVSSPGLSRPCAVMMLCAPSLPRRTRRWHLWNTALALPKTKSTVPEITLSRYNCSPFSAYKVS
ncbi:Os11g0570825 [Oryza sativa Japonica Group]|uniref:Os11g0570825 protein n=1 Tax=Oryza sativa subsp. japonica TaxID=39947 RepID=A0A0P0Y3D3_ORYSJ|nr:Os11g0570825 [Oryza sativa Japonica Group]